MAHTNAKLRYFCNVLLYKRPRGGGVVSQAYGDVPLDRVSFWIQLLELGRTFSDFLG